MRGKIELYAWGVFTASGSLRSHYTSEDDANAIAATLNASTIKAIVEAAPYAVFPIFVGEHPPARDSESDLVTGPISEPNTKIVEFAYHIARECGHLWSVNATDVDVNGKPYRDIVLGRIESAWEAWKTSESTLPPLEPMQRAVLERVEPDPDPEYGQVWRFYDGEIWYGNMLYGNPSAIQWSRRGSEHRGCCEPTPDRLALWRSLEEHPFSTIEHPGLLAQHTSSPGPETALLGSQTMEET